MNDRQNGERGESDFRIRNSLLINSRSTCSSNTRSSLSNYPLPPLFLALSHYVFFSFPTCEFSQLGESDSTTESPVYSSLHIKCILLYV